MKVMVPWNGDNDSLIDRFDARSMLDFYKENTVNSKKTDEETEMEEVCEYSACALLEIQPTHRSVTHVSPCSELLSRVSATSSNSSEEA